MVRMRKLVNTVRFNASADAVFSPPPLLKRVRIENSSNKNTSQPFDWEND